MKHLLAVGVLIGVAANDTWAQGSEIYTRWGPSGSQVNIPADTQTFEYEATISGMTAPYEVRLEVYHNSILEFTDSDLILGPSTGYVYSCSVEMGSWDLREGDSVTFVLKVIDTASGATLSTHCLNGVVCGT